VSERRQPALLEVLRSGQPVEAACAQAGLAVADFERQRDAYLRARLPPPAERLGASVSSPVEIVRDYWGVPHIWAASEPDALLGLGYCMGRDRLWQLDYLRREALGWLAELLGPEAHASDLRLRTVGIDLIAEREAERLDRTTGQLVEGFVAGVNLALEAQRGAWPVEFDLLDYEPEPWTVRDTVAVLRALWWQLTGRLENVIAAEAARRHLADDRLFDALMTPELPDERIVPADEAYRRAGRRGPDGVATEPTGSNNWAVAADRSTTGRALLASDPHLPFVHPSDFYEAHLAWPGHDVVGAHWAGVPGAQFGFNGAIAWGLTNNAASTRDLYVEVTDGDRYRRGRDWIPFQTREVEIGVRGQTARRHQIRSTDLGPIVNATVQSVDEAGDPPLSMRWVGAEHLDDLRSLLAVGRAVDGPTFRAALSDWALPVFNWIYADAGGAIGYQCAGRVPLRGRVVRGYRDPADPADSWQGYVEYDALPRIDRPRRGYQHSANNRVAPDDHAAPLYGAWAGGNRATRIRELIEASDRVSPTRSREIQQDVFVHRAARMAPPIARALAACGDVDLRRLGVLLSSWDYRYTLDTSAPAAFEAIVHHLAEQVLAARLPARLVKLLHGGGVALTARLLEGDPLAWFADAPVQVGAAAATRARPDGGVAVAAQERLEAAVVASARAALADLRERFGDDPGAWSWRRVHTIELAHPLAAGRPVFAAVANVGPAPIPGSSDTVRNAAGAYEAGFQVVSGAEYRLLVDFAAHPAALGVNVSGQSGQPGSRHFADQFDDWAGQAYHPLLLDRAAVEAQATGRVEIRPD
jgi:penicillin G amidase